MNTAQISEAVTMRIIEAIEKGGLNWLRGWRVTLPQSIASGKTYNGINALLLMLQQETHGYKSPLWVTFKETQKRGGHVLKGAKASPIIFYEMRKATERDAKTGEEQTRAFPFMRLYYVFNVEQTTLNISSSDAPKFSPIEAAESIAANYKGAPTLLYGGNRAFYVPSSDTVQLPHKDSFTTPSAYYATLFHEYSHSTGAKHRLNRTLTGSKNTEVYAFEELIAELSAAFLCARSGIEGEAATQNNAAYVASWLKALHDDKRLIFKAAKAAQEATDLIIGAQRANKTEAAHGGEVQNE